MQSAQDFYDANRVVQELREKLSHHLYAGDRRGVVPPHILIDVLLDIQDAHATLDALLRHSAVQSTHPKLTA